MSSMQVKILPATVEQQPVIENLLELYAHDFSEINDLQLNDNGRFGYLSLPLYWQESHRRPFLIKVDDQLAGFALITQGSQVTPDNRIWDVTEFFIARRYRRHGVGTRVAHELWRTFPTRWEVRVTKNNQAGLAFWQRAVSNYVGNQVTAVVTTINQKNWHVFSFNSELTTEPASNKW